jgi:signal transduction histidine kinase
VGIEPANQHEIFREFYKVPSHAGTEEGFGLGLYIVGRLCNILGHPVQLKSKPGRGTVFRLLMHPTELQAAAERAAASTIDIKATPFPLEGEQHHPAPAQ